MKVKVSFFRIC